MSVYHCPVCGEGELTTSGQCARGCATGSAISPSAVHITWPAHSHDVLITEIARLTRELEAAQAETRQRIKDYFVQEMLQDAEVARLRTALESIAANTCCDRCQEAALVAKAALEGHGG